MQFLIRLSSNWRTLLHSLLDGWLGRGLPSFGTIHRAAPGGAIVQNGTAQRDTPNVVNQCHAIPKEAMTPIKWLAGLPRDMSLVISIDQPTCQIMEMVAMSRKQAAEYLRTPIYTDHQTRWQSLGQNRLRRTDFAPAIAFQQKEDALNELESLFSARWHTTTELSYLDQSILLAYETVFPASVNLADESKSDTQSPNPSPVSALKGLLLARKVVSDELARIDEAGIPALQKRGTPLPQVASAAGQISSPL